jgi:NTE family protein
MLKPTVFFVVLFLSSCVSFQENFVEKEEVRTNFSDIDVDVVLVLGAGGSKGLAHIGVLEVLQEANIPIDLIIGCSSGSIVGSLYADSKDIKKVRKKMMRVGRKDILGASVVSSKMGFSNGKVLKRFLQRNIKSKYFAKLKIPFWSVATNLKNGQLAVFSHGQIVPAVAASAAYPAVFEPVIINQTPYVDGGVVSPIPTEIAKKTKAKVIIAVDISSNLSKKLPTNLFGVAKRSMEIGYLNKSKQSHKDADIIIIPDLGDSGTFSEGYNEKNFLAGRKEAVKLLPKIKELLEKKQIALLKP